MPFIVFRSGATLLNRNKLKGATAMLNMFSGSKSSAEDDADFEEDRDRLRDFQFKMLELQVRQNGTMQALAARH